MNLPLPLKKIVESIAYDLPKDEGQAFSDAVLRASDKKDLSLVHWAFLGSELRALPNQQKHIQAVIDTVISGMDRLAAGKAWPEAGEVASMADNATYDAQGAAQDAAQAATYAAEAAAGAAGTAAYAAGSAAYAAAHTAAEAELYAADYDESKNNNYATYAGTYAKSRQRQVDTLLSLIESAKAE